jgi:hypothetical protein
MTYLLLLCSALPASLRHRQHLVFANLDLRQQLAGLLVTPRRVALDEHAGVEAPHLWLLDNVRQLVGLA